MSNIEAVGGRPCTVCGKMRFPDELTFHSGRDYCIWCRWAGKWVFTGKPGKDRIKVATNFVEEIGNQHGKSNLR